MFILVLESALLILQQILHEALPYLTLHDTSWVLHIFLLLFAHDVIIWSSPVYYTLAKLGLDVLVEDFELAS